MKLKGEKMAAALYLLFNHELTSLQKKEALTSLRVERIQDPPSDIKALWRNIPPDITQIDSYLQPIKDWLGTHSTEGDLALIQGDFGACFLIVNFALERGLIPMYSTTARKAVEEYGEDGSVKITHNFRHRIFRRYGV